MNITNIEEIQKKCYGCEVCVNVCPVNAINMQFSDGFLYPVINNAKCIDCGKCAKQCIATREWDPKHIGEIHWCYNREDEVLKKSSSGGVFYELAQLFLSHNGAVYGVALDDNLNACHIGINNVKELNSILRSKYVQSTLNGIFKKVERDLKEGKEVLFSGTPCQIAGLNSFLVHPYENLLTVDFICHGVPSPVFYTNMLKNIEQKYQCKLKDITFREKDRGWRQQTTKYYFSNMRVVRKPSLRTFYYYSFLDNLSLRKSCFSCPFVQCHVSDITMGDFWGANDVEDKGVSLLILNTDKGKVFHKEISNKFVVGNVQESSIKECFRPRGTNASYDIDRRNIFFEDFFKIGYAATEKKYMQGVRLKQSKKTVLEKMKKVFRLILRHN